MNVPGSRTIMQRKAYAATNVVPIYIARSLSPSGRRWCDSRATRGESPTSRDTSTGAPAP